MIAVASGKGGVGKSTVATNLAAVLAQHGARVGLIDADIYGASQAGLLGQESAHCEITSTGQIKPVTVGNVSFVSVSTLLDGEAPVIWRAPMATRLITDFLTRVSWPDLDYLLIDLPPGTGDIQITLAQQAKLSGAIIVTTPQRVAYQIAEKAIQMFERVHIPILGIVENMSGFICGHCQQETAIFRQGGGEKLAEKYHCPVLSHIPLDAELIDLAEQGQSIIAAPESNAARQRYELLYKNLIPALKSQSNDLEPDSVNIVDGKQLALVWAEQHKNLRAYDLRILCPCASCVDETTGQPLLDRSTLPLDIGIEAISPVGRYGLKITFTDKHNTGIYTFKALKALPTYEEQQQGAFEV